MRTVSYAFEVNWSGGSWINESDYLISANGNEEIANPEESAFASNGYVSEASFTLMNIGRRFSPSYSSGPYYANITDGAYYQKKVRLTVVLGGVSSIVFQGFIKGITENARTSEEHGSVVLRCTSEDASLISRKVSSLSTTTQSFYIADKDESQLIAQTLSLSGLVDGVNYISQDYGSGTPTLDRGLFVLPWYWLDGESPLEDCWKIAAACGGRFYFDTSDSKYYYKNMQSFAYGFSATAQDTLSEDNCQNISPTYSDKELYSSVKVTIKPRRIGETTTIWEPDEVMQILPGETITLFAKFSSPVYSFSSITVKATNTGGYDVTGDLDIAQTINTQSISFSIKNNGIYHVFLRTFKIIGQMIEGGETTVYSKASPNTSFWASRSGKERAISDNPYIQTYAQGKALCDLLAGRQGYNNNKFSVKGYRGLVMFRPGYRATLVNATVGISEDAIVLSSSWTLSLGTFEQNLNLFATSHLYPQANGSYFVIGTHSQNSSKRYFY